MVLLLSSRASLIRPAIADQIRESFPTAPPWGSFDMGVRGRQETRVGPHLPLEDLTSLGSVTPALARMLSSIRLDHRERAVPAVRSAGRVGPLGESREMLFQGVIVSTKISLPYLPDESLRAFREGRGLGSEALVRQCVSMCIQ